MYEAVSCKQIVCFECLIQLAVICQSRSKAIFHLLKPSQEIMIYLINDLALIFMYFFINVVFNQIELYLSQHIDILQNENQIVRHCHETLQMNDMTVLFKQKQIILRFAEGIITNIYIKPSRISVIKKKTRHTNHS